MKKLSNLIRAALKVMLFGISNLVPKSKSLWVFGAWYGDKYSDNSKYLFEYVHANQQVDCYWLTKNKQVVEELKNKNLPVYHMYSLRGIWLQMRAGAALFCQALSDDLYGAAIGEQTLCVNLWHGLPLKKIMYDVFKPKQRNLFGKLEAVLTVYDRHRNDVVLSTSDETQALLAGAFQVPVSNVPVTGFPRNDAICVQNTDKESTSPFTVLYLPTFRGGVGGIFDLFEEYGFNLKNIETFCAENNVHLVIRMHPVNKLAATFEQSLASSSYVTVDGGSDVYDLFNQSDMLLTDYSGGYFDYLLTNKPILFTPFDIESYRKQDRELYYTYEDVTYGPYATNWPEVLVNIRQVLEGGVPATTLREYQTLKQRFHSPDLSPGDYSAEVFNEVSRRLNN